MREVLKDANGEILCDGDRATCKIDGVNINDAKILYIRDTWFVCQNIVNGLDAGEDKKGYKYSWRTNSSVTDLKKVMGLCVDVGDLVVKGDDTRKVLCVMGNCCLVSNTAQNMAYNWYTFEGLEMYGFKKVDTNPPETTEMPEITEMTVEEVAEKLGIEKDSLKIIADK